MFLKHWKTKNIFNNLVCNYTLSGIYMVDIDYVINKIEKNPLQKFRNQNKILKKYGQKGIKIYKAIKNGIKSSELLKKVKVDEDFLIEMLEWMKENGIIELVESAAKPKKTKKPKKEIKKEKKEYKKKEEKLEVEEEGIEEKTKKKIEELKPEEPSLKEVVKPKLETEEIKPEEEFGVGEEIKPEEEEEEINFEEPEELGNEEIKPEGLEFEENKEPEEEEGIEPSISEETPEESEEEIEPVPEENTEEEKEIEEIPQEEESEEIKPEEEVEEEKEEVNKKELTPSEKMIMDKYGEIGIKVYNMIDGQKTAEEIVNETGIKEDKLIEMLEWMEKQGIIKLHHKGAVETKPKEEKDIFSPLVGEATEENAMIEKNPIEIPIFNKKDLFSNMKAKSIILIKFGTNGLKVLDNINGKNSDIEIAIKSKVPVDKVREIIDLLVKNGLIRIDKMNREEVKKRFGIDAYTIYKKYGRNGVLLYELIDKDIDIKNMFKLTTKDKDKFVEMFLFIHKILGIEIPIDKEVIYEKLNSR